MVSCYQSSRGRESASGALRQPVPEAGVAAFLPLWRADRGALLRRMLAEGLDIVFSCVKAPWFDASWIGRRLDDATLAAMEAIAAMTRADGVPALDLGGERGEYHTMVLDGPLYAHRIPLVRGQPVELEGQPGQRERWWTIQ